MLYMFCTDTIGRDLLGGLELLDVDLGQSDVADLAFLLQRDEFADLVLGGELVIDAVQLEQVDGVHAEPAQTHLALLAQIGRVAEDRPLVGPGAQQTGFRRDDDAVGYGCSASRISSSDTYGPYESAVSMKLTPSSTARRSTRMHSSWSAGGPQTPFTGQAHGAEAEAVDGEVATDGEGSDPWRRGWSFHRPYAAQ